MPAIQAAGLLGEVAVDEAHEGGEPLGIGHDEEQVHVAREHDEVHDADPVAPGGPGDDTRGDVVELSRRPQEKAAVHRAGRDFDERVGRDVAWRVTHTHIERGRGD